MNSWLQRTQPTDGGQPGKISAVTAVRRSAGRHGDRRRAPGFLVEDDYRIALLDAEASFITTFLGKIEDPENGWSGPWQAHHASQHPGGHPCPGAWATRLASQLIARYHFGARSRVRLALEDPTPMHTSGSWRRPASSLACSQKNAMPPDASGTTGADQ